MDDITFSLWHGVLQDTDRYAFDAVAEGFEQLNEGTPELMGRFLAALGLSSEPIDWDVEPFRTPYYAVTPDAAPWRDRYRLAWRVIVVLTRALKIQGRSRLPGRSMTSGWDDTWQDPVDLPLAESATERAVVIADFGAHTWHKVSSTIGQLGSYEALYLTQDIVQARINCGLITFPDESEVVDGVVAACREAGASVYWADTIKRFTPPSDNASSST